MITVTSYDVLNKVVMTFGKSIKNKLVVIPNGVPLKEIKKLVGEMPNREDMRKDGMNEFSVFRFHLPKPSMWRWLIMAKYFGLDVHKKVCYATVLDERGEIVKEGKFRNERAEFKRLEEYKKRLITRDLVLERDKHRCGICRGRDRIEVHMEKFTFGNESTEHYIAICHLCHLKKHLPPVAISLLGKLKP